ncbi:MAG: trimeric intracellular cation channel family protein [Magnetospirillum sp.]|nr:trimeric intracellular cation channel family protein [Magnetospirillum sp.]
MISEAKILQDAAIILDLIGVAVFAVTGALVAARRQMDPIGFIIVGTATAIGGGTMRDLVLGVRPVFWVTDQSFLVVSIVASLATFWAARSISKIYRLLLWMDAVGMAMFAVAGTQKAANLGAGPVVSVLMGVMTASFGGLIRDVLCGEKPLLFHREIYASAALIGAGLWLALGAASDLAPELRTAFGFAAAFGVRAAAIRWGITMPHYQHPDS